MSPTIASPLRREEGVHLSEFVCAPSVTFEALIGDKALDVDGSAPNLTPVAWPL
jgi:hypothetical protein